MLGEGIRTLCTLGPASLNPATIEKLTERGVGCFRINMSHSSIPDLRRFIELIRRHSDTTICIDTEGAQVRTGRMADGVELRLGQRVRLITEDIEGSATTFTLRPAVAVTGLAPGNLVAVDFDSVLLRVVEVFEGGVDAVVVNRGEVKSNRAVTLYPAVELPALSDRDLEAVKVGAEYGIGEYALSFANSARDVEQLRRLVGSDAKIIAKIESQSGVCNLDAILKVADGILIDRGDLSREVPLENIPFLQKLIIRKGRSAGRPVYVATNLLESMLTKRKPTRAELNDVINTLIDGASGLVLAAETAIGEQPIAAVDMLMTLIERYKESLDGYRVADLLVPGSLLLPRLHGQATSQPQPQKASPRTVAIVHELPLVTIDARSAVDVAQLVSGGYSPLAGFMVRGELESVLDDCRLPDGAVWPMPIILQVSKDEAVDAAAGRTVALREEGSEKPVAVLQVQERFSPDLADVARRWFGTDDPSHAGVARLMANGPVFLGGRVELVDAQTVDRSAFALTPEQTRMIFSVKGWTRVVGFHTWGIPHRAHEFLVREALVRSNADGLLIHPGVGPTQVGAFSADAVLGAYDVLVEEAFPLALLGAFPDYPRHSGAREAVFAAICRKNFGCSHFVLGPESLGRVSQQEAAATRQLFEQVGDIGIQVLRFDAVYHCASCGHVVESCEHGSANGLSFAGTELRDALSSGAELPSWLVRDSVSSFLKQRLAAGGEIFAGG